MSEKTVYVFVDGGCVEDVVGAVDFVVIDFDELGSHYCPLCRCPSIDLINENLVCKVCGVDWDNIPEYGELIEIFESAGKKPR